MNPSRKTNAPLRIAHTECSCGWGGQELRILSESAGLLARGHDVQLLCPEEAPIYQAARERHIPVTALPIAKRNWQGFAALRDWMRRNPVDVINTHSSTDSWLVALASRTLRRRPGIVRTRHISNHIARDPFTRWLYGRGADRLVTTGEELRRAFLEGHKLPADRVVSIPTAVDSQHFRPGDCQAARRQLGLPADRLIVGVVATIRRLKGHVHLLEALAKIPRRAEVLFVFVGDGPNRPAVEQAITEHGLSEQVLMAGQQKDVRPWLHAMDIFALPSCAEGVPQCITQAMCCELPVLSTSVGSIPEAVAHERTGLLVPPADAAALAQALSRLIDDPALRRRFGKQGRETAIDKFSLESMLDNMETVFRQAAGRGQAQMASRTARAA